MFARPSSEAQSPEKRPGHVANNQGNWPPKARHVMDAPVTPEMIAYVSRNRIRVRLGNRQPPPVRHRRVHVAQNVKGHRQALWLARVPKTLEVTLKRAFRS